MALRCLVYKIPECLYCRLKEYSDRSGCRMEDVAVFALIRYLEIVGFLYERVDKVC